MAWLITKGVKIKHKARSKICGCVCVRFVHSNPHNGSERRSCVFGASEEEGQKESLPDAGREVAEERALVPSLRPGPVRRWGREHRGGTRLKCGRPGGTRWMWSARGCLGRPSSGWRCWSRGSALRGRGCTGSLDFFPPSSFCDSFSCWLHHLCSKQEKKEGTTAAHTFLETPSNFFYSFAGGGSHGHTWTVRG